MQAGLAKTKTFDEFGNILSCFFLMQKNRHIEQFMFSKYVQVSIEYIQDMAAELKKAYGQFLMLHITGHIKILAIEFINGFKNKDYCQKICSELILNLLIHQLN